MDSWPDRIPDGIEPLVGYRMWVYTLRHGRAQLHSITSIFGWDSSRDGGDWDDAASSWVVASCAVGSHPRDLAPDEDCSCGFYALTTLSGLVAEAPPALFAILQNLHEMSMPADEGNEVGIVLGRVELAGKIIEHEYGYRAERARIAELIPIEGTEQTVMRLAARLRLAIGPPVGLPVDGLVFTPPRRPVPPRTNAQVSLLGYLFWYLWFAASAWWVFKTFILGLQ